MISYLTTGQVLPTGSPIHRLDPRTRLLGFLVLLIAFISISHVGPAFLALMAVIALVALARIPPRYALKSLWLLLPWLIVIVLVQITLGVGNAPGCRSLLAWGPLQLTACTLRSALITLMRFAGLVLLIGLFTWTSPIPSLVRGLEALASPLAWTGLPAHELALVGVIAVRFIPTMALEFERLRKAQRARGADLGGGRGGFLGRVRNTLPLIVPIFVLALQRAERLAEAMEARAYSGGRGRGRYACLHLRRADWLALGLLALFVIIILWT